VVHRRAFTLWRFFSLAVINPLATVVLLVLFVLLVRDVGLNWNERSFGADFIRHRILQRAEFAGGPLPQEVHVLLEEESARVIGAGAASWDDLYRVIFERPDDVGRALVLLTVERTGVWAPTRHEQSLSIEWRWYGEAWAEDDRARGERAVLAHLAAEFPGSPYADFTQGTGLQAWTIIGGHARNLATLLVAVLLGMSLAWVPRVPRWARRARHRLLGVVHVCRHCGYDLRGLESAICPECGRDIPGERR
jgi:hypothetical protein